MANHIYQNIVEIRDARVQKNIGCTLATYALDIIEFHNNFGDRE